MQKINWMKSKNLLMMVVNNIAEGTLNISLGPIENVKKHYK